MQRWQYRFERQMGEAIFNLLGADGWEFVCMCEDRAVFKRPIS
jgi:hypothetical protein